MHFVCSSSTFDRFVQISSRLQMTLKLSSMSTRNAFDSALIIGEQAGLIRQLEYFPVVLPQVIQA
jgi:hypothetical protein